MGRRKGNGTEKRRAEHERKQSAGKPLCLAVRENVIAAPGDASGSR